jgi:hypothetical protein
MRNSLLLTIAATALLVGCSRPPAVQIENLALVASLRTACSAKNEEWLGGVERAITARHAAGSMSDAEKAHFEKLIDRAKGGDWQGAEKQCYQFERAQLNRSRPEASATAHTHQHPPGVEHLSVLNRK